MNDYVCSHCGESAYYDGRCGDGPVLMCKCVSGCWVQDRCGGYQTNPTGARPIPREEFRMIRRGSKQNHGE